MTDEPVVDVAGMHLSRQHQHILNDVSFTVAQGESVAIMGASGSGKTTLLQAIAGLIPFDQGEVTLAGLRLAAASQHQKSQLRLQRVGFVFQFADLVPELTIVENVMLPALLNKLNRKSARTRAMTLLEQLSVQQVANKYPRHVSGGEAQRTAIARALVNDQRVLLADEPTGALDSTNRNIVLELMTQAVKRCNTTLLIVTHDDHVASHCSRLIQLHDGRIISDSATA